MTTQPSVIEILTMDEIEELNMLTGKTFEEVFAKGLQLGKPAKILLWILAKRENPEAKIEDFGKYNLLQVTEIMKAHLEPKK